MCGRFYTDMDSPRYQRALAALSAAEPDGAALALLAHGEIFPADLVPVLTARGMRAMRWGFSRDAGKGLLINARAETAPRLPTFSGPFQTARCLIPAAGYFEWRRPDAGKSKEKYRLGLSDDALFCMAGLFREESAAASPRFVILTTEAAPELAFVHDRMPLILGEADWRAWLSDPAAARTLLKRPAPLRYAAARQDPTGQEEPNK